MLRAFNVLALLAFGCGNSPGTGEVTIGTGTTEFESIGDGAELEVVAGPQGGFHFHVHARMRGLDPGDPSMPGLIANPATTFAAFRESGEQIDFDFPPYRLGYVDIGGGEFELPSGRILQIEEAVIPAIYGERIRLTVEIRDEGGRTATAELSITAIEEADSGPDAGVDAS